MRSIPLGLTLAAMALAATAIAVPAQGQARMMTVAEFLDTVARLRAQGLGAALSPEVGRLQTAMKGVTDSYRSDVRAARAAGRRFSSCPPPAGQARISSNELITEFERFPRSQRERLTIKDGFYRVMARRYPCPA